MIKVDSITITEFRGIRDLTLDFRERNFAICGPNGTGKSGVVDALEFVLTGNVSRLSGEGSGEVSLKRHGPHVDARNNPDKARVKAKITITGLNKTVTVERSVEAPTIARVTPSDPQVLQLLKQVEQHPEVVLSRREIIRYVLAAPGKRAEEVRALLHLDQVEQVRVGLQRIANACEKQLPLLSNTVAQACQNLLRALGVSEFTEKGVLAAVNAQRLTLGLPALGGLSETVSLKDGMAVPVPAKPQSIPKEQALADILAAQKTLADVSSAATIESASGAVLELEVLAGDPLTAAALERDAFYASGVELIDDGTCPFCDMPWDPSELRKHVQAKIDHLEGVSARRKAAEAKLAPLIALLTRAKATFRPLIGYAGLATPPLSFEAASNYSAYCGKAVSQLTDFLPICETITLLRDIPTVPQAVSDAISRLHKAVSALPEPTKQDAAREWLTVAQERLDVWREAKRKQKTAKDEAQLARHVSDIYAKTSDTVLAGIYSAVEADFAAIYASVNRDDEGAFKAQLTPSLGKLGFGVDFYGRGFFPPGAYHSEGHQDNMGLCLYLALMRHLQGASFTLAVLDDVLMSVDAGHRREVCILLKKEFPMTQFIMTTHDPVWLRHMKTEKLIGGRSAVQFRSWDVDHGPTKWDDRDVWTEVSDHLKQNDVRAAAALLRNYLEYTSAELCHRLRAPVEFRGDGRYQLGDLLPAAIAQMRKIYTIAKEAASSWNKREVLNQVVARATEFARLADRSNAEQWQVSGAIHYNSWDNLGKEDFAPVVTVFHDLLGGFSCPECNGYLRVSPDRETPEELRCDCGGVNISLCKKAK